MATLSSLHSFVPATAAKSTEVNENFNTIKAFVEGISTGVNIDSNAITALKLATSAVTEEKIAGTAVTVPKLASTVLNLFTPVGSIVQYAGVTEPAGWKLCNGQALNIASYTDLYNILTSSGSVFRFGANPNGTTFLLPNLQGRLPVGLDATQTEFDVVGETGGTKTIAEANLPAHKHAVGTLVNSSTSITHNHTATVTDAGHNHVTAVTTNSSTSHLHNNTTGFVAAGTNGSPTNSTDNLAVQNHATGITVNNSSNTESHTHTITGDTANTGSGNVFLPPYIVINYLIKVS
jgi:microcystin-dependent protein